MWFLFGLVALPLFLVLTWILRRDGRVFRKARQGDFQWAVLPHGRLPHETVKAAVPAPPSLELCLHPERRIDRVFKALRISVEQQVDGAAFDERVYLQSDDPRVGDAFRQDAALRDAVLRLFAWRAETGHTRLRRLRVIDGRLIADIRCRRGKGESIADAVRRELLPLMQAVTASLHSIDTGVRRDPFAWRAALLLALSTTILVTGLLEFLVIQGMRDQREIDDAPLWSVSFPIGVLLTIGMVVLTFALLGRRSRTHIVLVEILTLGFAGCVLLSDVKVIEFNQDYDRTEAQRIYAAVAELRKYKCGRRNRRTCYDVVLTSPDPDIDGLRIRIDRGLWEQSRTGQLWHVYKREGALGVPWMESYGPPVPATRD